MVNEMACVTGVGEEVREADAAAPVDITPLKLQEILFDKEQITREKPAYRFFKRVQDVVFSALALIVLAVPMFILAVIIYIDSPGASPISRQKRIGLNGREFMFYKFRTMVPNAEEKLKEVIAYNNMDGPVFKMKNDPRITKVGSILRQTSCDELPQLFCVLIGDMSLVGPRPPLPHEAGRYSAYDRQRLYVKPGLSCYWQIQPKRNEISFQRWMELDRKYVQERGFLTDWKIILKTVRAVLAREGW